MPTVLVTSRSFSSGSVDLEAALQERGYSVLRGPADHDPAMLSEILGRAEGWIAGTGPVDARHLELAPNLRVIARYGVGYEAVDLAAAASRGVVVTNTPGANTNAVAEHTIALLLSVLRAVPEGDRRVRTHNWSVVRGRELGSLTVGLIGFGRIGQTVARLLSGFGSRVLVADPYVPAEVIAAVGAQPAALESLPLECDVVSLHSPGGQTVIDARWLKSARPGLVLVNAARPELVDENAVAAELTAGTLTGYAADTLSGDSSGDDSPLLSEQLADRVVVTPHFGAQTVQAVDEMGSVAVQNLLAVLAGQQPLNPVPLPDPEVR